MQTLVMATVIIRDIFMAIGMLFVLGLGALIAAVIHDSRN